MQLIFWLEGAPPFPPPGKLFVVVACGQFCLWRVAGVSLQSRPKKYWYEQNSSHKCIAYVLTCPCKKAVENVLWECNNIPTRRGSECCNVPCSFISFHCLYTGIHSASAYVMYYLLILREVRRNLHVLHLPFWFSISPVYYSNTFLATESRCMRCLYSLRFLTSYTAEPCTVVPSYFSSNITSCGKSHTRSCGENTEYKGFALCESLFFVSFFAHDLSLNDTCTVHQPCRRGGWRKDYIDTCFSKLSITSRVIFFLNHTIWYHIMISAHIKCLITTLLNYYILNLYTNIISFENRA